MSAITAPKHLPPEVAAVWVEVVTAYGPGHRRIHGPQLEAYCGQVARLRDAQRRLSEEQIIVADSRQQAMQHPALAIERAAQDEIRKWGDKFTGPIL